MIRLVLMPIALLLLSNLMTQEAFAEVKIEVNSVQLKFEQSNEDLGPKMKPERNSKITLTCEMTATSGTLEKATLKWTYPNNATQDSDYRLNNAISTSEDKKKMTSQLTISDLRAADIGKYACIGKQTNSSKAVQGNSSVKSLPMLTIGDKSYDIASRPGEAISIKCEASANPKAQAKWEGQKVDGVDYSTPGVLKIASVIIGHRGKYVCKANNSIGENSVTVFLRVKNPNSYVVPLIVIVVELIILGIIVAVYELMMRKKRQEAALSQDKTD